MKLLKLKYSKEKNLELLKSLQESTKMFSDEEFLKLLESKRDENFFELEVYSAMMISHLH